MDKSKTIMGKLCEFILSHPQWEKAFPGFSRRDVIVKLVERQISGGLAMAMSDNVVRGIVIFNVQEHRLLIEHIIGDRGMVRWGLMMWRNEYPNLPIEFERIHRGGTRKYRMEFMNTVNIQTVMLSI